MRSRDELLRLSREIHAHPELAFEEQRGGSAAGRGAAQGAASTVEAGAYGLETAFAAEFGARAGPASRCSPSTTRCRRSATPAATT